MLNPKNTFPALFASIVSSSVLAQVPGDECANALTAVIGMNLVNTAAMTASPNAPYPDQSCPALGWTPTTRDAWFRLEITVAGVLSLDFCPSTYDTSVVLYRGTCESLERIACDDDGCGSSSGRSRIVDLPVGSGPILIRVGGAFSAAGTASFEIAFEPEMPAAAYGIGWSTFGEAVPPLDLGGVLKVAAGYNHSVALRTDGSVRCWGQNAWGEAAVPANLPPIVEIAAGGYAPGTASPDFAAHTVALGANGTIYTWGSNAFGQRDVPAGLGPWRAIAAGGRHTIAVDANERVHAWGDCSYGQCSPPKIVGPRDISAGLFHSVAVNSSGNAECWGLNEEGQCTPPAGLSGLTAISAGRAHVIALRSNGTVAAWGSNNQGQCTPPPELGVVAEVAAGGNTSIALRPDGTVVTWGWYGGSSLASLGSVTGVSANDYHVLFALRRDCDADGINDPFELATSDCNANATHDCWDAEQDLLEDCNGNGLGDTCEKRLTVNLDSGPLSPFGFGHPRTFEIPNASACLEPFWLNIEASGDFDAYLEFARVRIGDRTWDLFQWGSLCWMNSANFELTPDLFNAGIGADGTWRCELTTSSSVDAFACSQGSSVRIFGTYTGAAPSDCDGNGRLDGCQIADGTVPDTNGNGIIDSCENLITSCPTDFNADRITGPADLAVLLGAWNSPGTNGSDLNGDGVVDSADLTILLGAWGPCPES